MIIHSIGWRHSCRNLYIKKMGIASACSDRGLQYLFSYPASYADCGRHGLRQNGGGFFPALTELHERPSKSVGILYIGPLKALINDQFERLKDLLTEGNIPVWHWHGDVPQAEKTKLMKNPSGVLQITPESLEGLLMNRPNAIPALFHDLRYVIIDEVHAFMGADRGFKCSASLLELSVWLAVHREELDCRLHLVTMMRLHLGLLPEHSREWMWSLLQVVASCGCGWNISLFQMHRTRSRRSSFITHAKLTTTSSMRAHIVKSIDLHQQSYGR